MFSLFATFLPFFPHFSENLILSALSALLSLLYLIWISDIKMFKRILYLIKENQDRSMESKYNNPSQCLKVLALNIKIPAALELQALFDKLNNDIHGSVFLCLLYPTLLYVYIPAHVCADMHTHVHAHRDMHTHNLQTS